MKYTDICTFDAQGRIVIPTKMRKILNLVNQDSLEAELSGQEIHLRKCGELPIDTHRLAEEDSYERFANTTGGRASSE